MRHNCWDMMLQCHLVGAISNFEGVCVLLALTFSLFFIHFISSVDKPAEQAPEFSHARSHCKGLQDI